MLLACEAAGHMGHNPQPQLLVETPSTPWRAGTWWSLSLGTSASGGAGNRGPGSGMCAPFPATPGPTEFRPVLVFFGPAPPTPQQLPSLWCCLWEKGAPDLTTCVAPAFPVPPRPEAAEVPNATGSSRHAWDTRHACSLQASWRCAHMHTRGTRSTHACPIPDTERAHTPPYKKRRRLSRTLPRASTVRTAR